MVNALNVKPERTLSLYKTTTIHSLAFSSIYVVLVCNILPSVVYFLQAMLFSVFNAASHSENAIFRCVEQ